MKGNVIMENEIKIGDRVMVSKDAPKSYLHRIKRNNLYAYYKVYDIEGNMAFINLYQKGLSLRDLTSDIVIPTKYLVKVDAEAKEAKFKYQVGQKVKSAYDDEILTIKDRYRRVGHDNVYRVEEYTYAWNECELKPYTATTEQTEAEKPNVGSIKIPVEVDLSDSYWDAYAADLAKEIVLKTVNFASDKRPSVIAEYATDVAKAVVEGLKRK